MITDVTWCRKTVGAVNESNQLIPKDNSTIDDAIRQPPVHHSNITLHYFHCNCHGTWHYPSFLVPWQLSSILAGTIVDQRFGGSKSIIDQFLIYIWHTIYDLFTQIIHYTHMTQKSLNYTLQWLITISRYCTGLKSMKVSFQEEKPIPFKHGQIWPNCLY